MRRATFGWWLLILPALALLMGFYVAPIIKVLLISFTDPEPGLQNYERLFTSASVQRVILTTLRICLITTVLALLLGYALAYAITKSSPDAKRWWLLAEQQGGPRKRNIIGTGKEAVLGPHNCLILNAQLPTTTSSALIIGMDDGCFTLRARCTEKDPRPVKEDSAIQHETAPPTRPLTCCHVSGQTCDMHLLKDGAAPSATRIATQRKVARQHSFVCG
jgi:hypothetical protein